ncbi:MAG: hypothetical protein JW954_05615 [Dehalococcoidaceae bacterium]|nr:hypothetical protein [Dehalococcoidaceae bacterium]
MQKGFNLKERDFFNNLFTRQEIESILKEVPASEMFNFKSPSFKKLGVGAETLSNEKLIELMIKEPRLVRRPIVVTGGKTYFGASRKVLADELGL